MSERQVEPASTAFSPAELARVRLGEAHYTSFLVPAAAGAADDARSLVATLVRSPSWALHAGRLRADARQLGLPPPTFAAMVGAVERTLGAALSLEAVEHRAAGALWRVRLDCNATGPADIRTSASGSVVSGQATLLQERVRPAAHVQIGPRLRNADDPFAGAKRASVAMEFAILRACQRDGYDEAVLLDVHGHLSEAITSALWFGRDGAIWTPAAACAPLRSTTTALAMALAQSQGWSLQTGRFGPDALLNADWAVLANAVAGARPVASVNARALAAPPPWLVAATRDLVDGGPAADAAVAVLRAGGGPAWACAAVCDGIQGADGTLP